MAANLNGDKSTTKQILWCKSVYANTGALFCSLTLIILWDRGEIPETLWSEVAYANEAVNYLDSFLKKQNDKDWLRLLFRYRNRAIWRQLVLDLCIERSTAFSQPRHVILGSLPWQYESPKMQKASGIKQYRLTDIFLNLRGVFLWRKL